MYRVYALRLMLHRVCPPVMYRVYASAKPKPKPVTKLAPEYPSSTPRRSSRQGPKRTGSGEAVVPSKKAKLPPDQGDNRTGSVVDSLGAYNQAVGENPDGASEALDVLSVSDVIPDDILNQAMDDHDAKTEKHEPNQGCGAPGG